MNAPLLAAAIGGLPLMGLGVLALRTSISLGKGAWLVAALTSVLAVGYYELDPTALALAIGKGVWIGTWVLLIVIPALLLFEIADRSGSLDRLSDGLGDIAPTVGRRVLVTGWVFPSFLQGVAGFGVPVVVAAPMLVRAGVSPVAAVAASLVGYHWSVTFGSMGSSFFVAAGVTQLGPAATIEFALKAAGILAVTGAAGALLLLRRLGSVRDAILPGTVVAVIMGLTLVFVAGVQPALGSTTAGLTGLLVSWAVFPLGGKRPAVGPLLTAAFPYLALSLLVVVAFGVPPVREALARVPEVAPSFPSTQAAFGHVNPAVEAHQPLRPLLHPAPYLLVSTGLAALLFRRLRWWSGEPGLARTVLGAWLRRSRSTALSLLGLTTLSAVMVDSGIVALLAGVMADRAGIVFVGLAPVVGALGTVLTGSTTASNALFAPLQASAAAQLDTSVTTLLAAQTVGGNIGNSLTPINVLIAAAAVGATGREGEIIRAAAKDAWPLLLLAIAATALLVVVT